MAISRNRFRDRFKGNFRREPELEYKHNMNAFNEQVELLEARGMTINVDGQVVPKDSKKQKE